MTQVKEAIDLVNSVPQGDPVMEAVKWIFLVLVLLGSASVPFMMIMNKKTKSRNENNLETAISDAGSTLYSQLVTQMTEYKKLADEAFRERNELMHRVAKLESMTEQFQSTRATVDRLRVKLDLKDQEIRKLLDQGANEREKFLEVLQVKDRDIFDRDQRISQLERSVSALEKRLAIDEQRQAAASRECPFIEKVEAIRAANGESNVVLKGSRLNDPTIELKPKGVQP